MHITKPPKTWPAICRHGSWSLKWSEIPSQILKKHGMPHQTYICTVCSSNINNQIWSSTASPTWIFKYGWYQESLRDLQSHSVCSPVGCPPHEWTEVRAVWVHHPPRTPKTLDNLPGLSKGQLTTGHHDILETKQNCNSFALPCMLPLYFKRVRFPLLPNTCILLNPWDFSIYQLGLLPTGTIGRQPLRWKLLQTWQIGPWFRVWEWLKDSQTIWSESLKVRKLA